MAEFLDYNPTNGCWYEHDQHLDEGAVTIKQDVQPVLDYANESRNSGINDKHEIFSHYAIIPASVQVEIARKGIPLHDMGAWVKEIEQNYPHLKVTNMRHHVRS